MASVCQLDFLLLSVFNIIVHLDCRVIDQMIKKMSVKQALFRNSFLLKLQVAATNSLLRLRRICFLRLGLEKGYTLAIQKAADYTEDPFGNYEMQMSVFSFHTCHIKWYVKSGLSSDVLLTVTIRDNGFIENCLENLSFLLTKC